MSHSSLQMSDISSVMAYRNKVFHLMAAERERRFIVASASSTVRSFYVTAPSSLSSSQSLDEGQNFGQFADETQFLGNL